MFQIKIASYFEVVYLNPFWSINYAKLDFIVFEFSKSLNL